MKKTIFLLIVCPLLAFAEGALRSIIVFGNTKTERKTILNIINVEPRSTVDQKLLKLIDDRLINSGLFKSVKVSQRENPDGTYDVRVSVVEKQLWFVFPIVQAWSSRYSFGAAFGESNLIFPNARTLMAFQAGNRLNRFFYVIDAKNMFDTSLSLRVWTLARQDEVPLYTGSLKTDQIAINDAAVSVSPGYQWTNEIRTSYGVNYRFLDFGSSANVPEANSTKHDVSMAFEFSYDSLKRRDGFAVGDMIKAGYEFSGPRFGSGFSYHTESVEWIHGVKYGSYFNHLFFLKGQIGDTLPFHKQLTLGGESLRGYQEKQFRGDTLITLRNDLMFPLWRPKSFTLFGVGFHDLGFLYFDQDGIDRSSLNNGVGGGFRMSLASILAPVFGLDFGYGLEDKSLEIIFALGLVSF